MNYILPSVNKESGGYADLLLVVGRHLICICFRIDFFFPSICVFFSSIKEIYSAVNAFIEPPLAAHNNASRDRRLPFRP